jgi:hypothetical protein
MSPKALKLVVVALLIVVAGLLLTIRRLANQTPPAAEEQATVELAPASEPAPLAAASAPVMETEKPLPIQTRRPVTRPRTAQVAAAPAAIPAPEPAPAAVVPPSIPPPAPEPRPEPLVPPPPRQVTIPAGTALAIRTQNTLSTERNLKGDTFTATLEEPLVVDGLVIAEKGSTVEGHVVRAEKAGRVEGLSALGVELVRLHTSDGQRVSIATELHEVQGERSRGSDAKKVGLGAGLGAVIGAIAGGGKGAAIGAGAGAGAGAGTVLATRGEHAVIPSESRLTFHMRTPVEVTERR